MNQLTYLAAVAIVGSLGLSGCNRSDESNNTNPNQPGQSTANSIQNAADKTGNALNNGAHDVGNALAGATTRAADMAQQASASDNASNQAPDAKSIRNTLSDTINSALTKDGFSSLVKDFTDNGRNQIGDYSKLDFTELNGIVAQIQGDWKSKYGNDFDSSQTAFLDNSVQVQQGNGPAGNNNTGDMTVASVTLVPNAGFNGATMTMKQQGVLRDWYISTPSTLTAAKLQANLSAELTKVKDGKADWPSDQNAAYRLVADHVFAAVMDQSTH